MSKTSDSGKGLLGSLATLASTLVASLYTRLELLSIEIEEDREHLLELVTLYLVSYFSLIVAVVLLTILLVVAFWDTHRLIVLSSLSATYLVVGLITLNIASQKAKRKPKIFATSLLELMNDRNKIDSR